MMEPEVEVVRLSINLHPDSAALLKSLAEARGDTATETIRRAIAVLGFFTGELAAGREIVVRDGRSFRKVEFIDGR